MIIVALIGAFILTKTYFGRQIFALGATKKPPALQV